MRKFINGKYEGTRLEIMPSKAATQLPNGTPIKEFAPATGYNTTQTLHAEGQLDVHAPQVFEISDPKSKDVTRFVGPSIAQEWKLLINGERPYYRRETPR
jgi:hypothetical protein